MSTEVKPEENQPIENPVFDLSNLKIDWEKKNQYGEIKMNDHPFFVLTPRCHILFNFIPFPFDKYINVHIRTYNKTMIEFLTLIDEMLTDIIPNYNATFLRGRGISKTIIAQIPIDKEKRLLINIYDENEVLVNDRKNPTITVHDLLLRYNVNPGRASMKLWIKNVHNVGNTQYVNINIVDLHIKAFNRDTVVYNL